jgi:hypothetical protein
MIFFIARNDEIKSDNASRCRLKMSYQSQVYLSLFAGFGTVMLNDLESSPPWSSFTLT